MDETARNDAGGEAARAYFEGRRAAVDGFVARHFTWPGALRLHSAALGWDVLRTPVNLILSQVYALTRLLSFICGRVGLPRAARWFGERRIFLRTTVADRVAALVLTDLLDLSLRDGARARDPGALAEALLSARPLPDPAPGEEGAVDAAALGRRIAAALAEYVAVRSAVAEMTIALCALTVGAVAFRALTPGMISLAPGVAEAVALDNAIAGFPLGETLGGLWYGYFGAGAPLWMSAAAFAVLIVLGAVAAAFAGVLADPLQARLGVHHRRLIRLIDTIEAEVVGADRRAFAAREHYYARALDVFDAAVSALRLFRN